MENSKNDGLNDLSREEMATVRGGAPVPNFTMPTWKYIESTPQWAIDNALRVGYEVEQI